MKEVTLTTDEVEALENYLFSSLIPYIQDTDNEVDNIRWMYLISGIWMKCIDAKEDK